MSASRFRGCETRACGKPGRPYPAGIRCDEHKPQASWRLSEPPASAASGGQCPGCGTAALAGGREVCQACGVVALLRAEAAAEV
jgi:hypothetical protein